MTVRSANGVVVKPVPEADRRARVLSDTQAAELVELGVRIEMLYGMPMDIEWTLTEGEFAIVQARPITALPPVTEASSTGSPPTEWKLPEGSYTAMRNNIVELMADPLTPLFSTLGLAAVNTSMDRLLASYFNRPGLMPEEIIITINDYAYYNGSWTAGQMARILLGSIGIMKYMFTGAVERWTKVGRPRYVATVEHWQQEPWRDLAASEILAAVRELAEAAIDAYGALVSGVLPAAWISEALFSFTYRAVIKRRDDPAAPVYLMGFDSTPIQADKSLYDLAQWARTRPELATYLADTPAPELVAGLANGSTPPDLDASDWHEWQRRFQSHLETYGHAIYSLDFGNPVPADDPQPLLETCKWFLGGQGANPHVRQQAAAERREQATQAILSRLKGLRLKLFRRLIEPAQRYAPLREDGLADVGLGYPLLRQMLRELGQRFADAGTIEEADQIFWLEQSEVEQAAAGLDRGDDLPRLTGAIAQRRVAWFAARRVAPPMGLVRIRFLGLELERAITPRSGRDDGDTLKGVAASPGSVTARARILHGPEDFSQMNAGEVLVAPLTTPAWTPLFARAAAIVTDIGGPLSHGSIVAREYGIPAVLGTESATKRIRNGQLITVDGSAGLVTLEQ
jgi:pyruvate,water dikinase